MNNIVRSALRINKFKPLFNAFKTSINVKSGYQQKQLTRSLWHMCNSSNDKFKNGLICNKHSDLCNCGCGKHSIHSKGRYNLKF